MERQSERLLDAYQAEIITLRESQLRRGKLQEELHRLNQEIEQFTRSRSEALHWQQIIEHADCFRHLLGENLERLSFADRQTVMQCLIKKVVVTGEHVDIYYIFPFDQSPQVYNSSVQPPEGTPGHFYRLRLADLNWLSLGIMDFDFTKSECQIVRSPVAAAVFDDQHWMFRAP